MNHNLSTQQTLEGLYESRCKNWAATIYSDESAKPYQVIKSYQGGTSGVSYCKHKFEAEIIAAQWTARLELSDNANLNTMVQ